MFEKMKVFAQYGLPQHLLSRLAFYLANARCPRLKNALIRSFIHHYQVDLSEAEVEDITAFENFNAFFTRRLKASARPITLDDSTILSPADGVISQAGTISDGKLLQAKGRDFRVIDLLGGSASMAESFKDGSFATVYLSPKDYHRVHMPYTGTLRTMVHIPGRLFSVNRATSEHIPNLFARNERVVALFDTAIGPMALVLVGAMIVASIETLWHGLVTPKHRAPNTWVYDDAPTTLQQGAEMGAFSLGSTVIALFPKDRITWNTATDAGYATQVGQVLGQKNL